MMNMVGSKYRQTIEETYNMGIEHCTAIVMHYDEIKFKKLSKYISALTKVTIYHNSLIFKVLKYSGMKCVQQLLIQKRLFPRVQLLIGIHINSMD